MSVEGPCTAVPPQAPRTPAPALPLLRRARSPGAGSLQWCRGAGVYAGLTVKSDVSTLPSVGPFSTMKLRSPVRMVDTDQAGFHVSGWKSVMERHNLPKQDPLDSAHTLRPRSHSTSGQMDLTSCYT